MNAALNINTCGQDDKIKFSSRLILSENLIWRMKKLDHEWLSVLLANAWIKQTIEMPKNISVSILVDAISKSNPEIMLRIKKYLDSRKINENEIFCISIGKTPYKQVPEKTFFYSIWVEEWKHNILREVDPLKIPSYLQVYINWNADYYTNKEIEALYEECVWILNSLVSNNSEVTKAKLLIQMILASQNNQSIGKIEKEYFIIWWNIAVEVNCSNTKLRTLDLMEQRAKVVEARWNYSFKQVLTRAWTIKKKDNSGWKIIKIF